MNSNVYALIPAGGKSSRMGRTKLALPVGKQTVLELVISALRQGGVEKILTVIGPNVTELIPLARGAQSQICLLPAETPDMRATIEAGLSWIEEHYQPGEQDRWLLVPGDHPLLDPGVVRQLLRARDQHPTYSIVLPTCQGKRGHPTLIDWRHVLPIRGRPLGEGINQYLREQQAETLEVDVVADTILMDLDTPEDYQRLRAARGS